MICGQVKCQGGVDAVGQGGAGRMQRMRGVCVHWCGVGASTCIHIPSLPYLVECMCAVVVHPFLEESAERWYSAHGPYLVLVLLIFDAQVTQRSGRLPH